MNCPCPPPNKTKFCKTFSIPLLSPNKLVSGQFYFFSNRFLQKLHHLHYHLTSFSLLATQKISHHQLKLSSISIFDYQYPLKRGQNKNSIGTIVFSSKINRLVTIDFFERYKTLPLIFHFYLFILQFMILFSFL